MPAIVRGKTDRQYRRISTEEQKFNKGGSKIRAAIYCRVSTEDQERKGTSLQSQLEACQNKARELGYEAPEAFTLLENRN